MQKVLHQPFDKLFKLTMKNLDVAREFLAAHLPPTLLKQIDLKTLALEPQSFIDDSYKSVEADLVFSVKMGRKKADTQSV